MAEPAVAHGPPSYAEIYAAHHARVVSLCRLLLRDPQEAAEVAQDVFLELHRQLPLERRPMLWGPWLSRVAVNRCRDRRRAGWWKLWRDAAGSAAVDHLPSAAPSPEDEAASRERRALLWQAFLRLPLRQREVFALRLVDGWSTDEVAAILGVAPGSVKRHLSRAVHRLRLALGGRS